MPSGKQVLLSVLCELSQGAACPPVDREASDKLRAAFFLHGSTASESWQAIDGVEWSADFDNLRHGITYDSIFLSDLFEELTSPADMPSHIKDKFLT